MMRRIDRELDLPSHVAKRVRKRIKDLESEYQAIRDDLETLSDAILQLNKRLVDLDSRLKAIEEKLLG